MNSTDKDKLKHDFLNSIVIINSMTKSASSFMNTISQSMDTVDINQKQMEKFLYSMSAIREQTSKIENYFLSLFNE
ncbi:Uncharacterised protein [Legionella pneumophila]|jgi:hypothetical protein|uniref:Uncharacterized protein n=11 Tax=Legionellaceae TaxID=444 RepID=A0A378KUL2_9GAMM|nr:MULTISPECIES: hypothetical protein [Legionellaceae]AMV16232.1 hypothetical protein ULM_35810 [Legionella pneumophila]AUH74175.1 hypothetical protein CAB17_19660 [Legionella sainthelensi]KTC67689.1 hypothetical protein Lani_3257 [Legionella anisa]KTC82915.1 hypothetical protein Lche_0138 [Legionella cherrii]KTC88908.1 hypothetical protein Ldum_3166 [Fluoribacter dumoffii NY 23]